LPCFAWRHHNVALPSPALPLLCYALLGVTITLLYFAVLCLALPLLCLASLGVTIPLPCFALQRLAFAK